MIPEIWQPEFLELREIPDRGLCGVQRFIYTCGLLVNMTFDGPTYGYSARYCYPSAKDATESLRLWDGTGDPPGPWIKEKVSERTRSKT